MLLGEDERPLPNILGTIIKYFLGLSAMSGPISQSFSQCLPAVHTNLLWMVFIDSIMQQQVKILIHVMASTG